MTTIVIDDRKKGATEMLELLGTLDFVDSIETASKRNLIKLKRQRLIKYAQKYDPLALAGAAENDQALDLVQIRKEWIKRK